MLGYNLGLFSRGKMLFEAECFEIKKEYDKNGKVSNVLIIESHETTKKFCLPLKMDTFCSMIESIGYSNTDQNLTFGKVFSTEFEFGQNRIVKKVTLYNDTKKIIIKSYHKKTRMKAGLNTTFDFILDKDNLLKLVGNLLSTS